MSLLPVFDLDGTLIDSDEALIAPFVALGIERDAITFGHLLDDECARLGISVEAYLAHYDAAIAQPFAGAAELLDACGSYAICSNKRGESGRAELLRLGWQPEVALFADAFDGAPKTLPPVLDALGLGAGDVVFVGDTAHDRACAAAVGARFVLAGWNPRATAAPGDLVLADPRELLDLIR